MQFAGSHAEWNVRNAAGTGARSGD
jgi:hypothetical protein